MKTTPTSATYQTREVLAAAYVKESDALSHTIVVETGLPLCKRVKPASIADKDAGDVNERPTCPTCAKRDPRFAVVNS